MTFSALLRHRVKIAFPPDVETKDGYGNPSSDLREERFFRRAFVQSDGRTEVPTGEGADTVVADWSVFLDARDGDDPDERCEVRWYAEDGRVHDLAIIGVERAQAPGTTHHLRVLCRRAS